jgi:hypothetical protein
MEHLVIEAGPRQKKRGLYAAEPNAGKLYLTATLSGKASLLYYTLIYASSHGGV